MEEDPLVGHPVLRTIRILSKSGTHTTVLAQNASTGQLVAIKLIPRGFDTSKAKYLLQELLNHYELTLAKHPHIVGLLDVFLTPKYLAIVMEYVDGENLQIFVEKAGGCIGEALARFLFQQLVIALDFCHRRGKVNRNIRSFSLLLQLSDSALPLLRMVDFSASKDTLRNSEPRSQVGTAMYCAPEILQNFSGETYDANAADAWSVGVVLFVMLFGRHPFSRAEDMHLPAQQQVLAMFKRLAAPSGSVDGHLNIPPMLPTSALPGALPGAPLSLPCADLLRGMLACDPRVRLTLDAVQRHEWFLTNLPEGAGLLNEVVEAEAAAVGATAVMPVSVATQLEHMVIQAAKGPVVDSAALAKELHGNGHGGGPGEGGIGGSGGGGGGGRAGLSGAGGLRQVRDSSGGGASVYAPTTPQSASQGQQQHRQEPQVPLFVRTVTTGATADVHNSVSIGTTVAAQRQQQPMYMQRLELGVPTHLHNGGDCAITGGGKEVEAMVTSSTGTTPADASLSGANSWPLEVGGGRDGSNGDGATDSDATIGTGDLNLPNFEALVMTLPVDDLMETASLDLFNCLTPRMHNIQQTLQHPLQPKELELLSNTVPTVPKSSGSGAGCAAVPSPQQPTTSTTHVAGGPVAQPLTMSLPNGTSEIQATVRSDAILGCQPYTTTVAGRASDVISTTAVQQQQQPHGQPMPGASTVVITPLDTAAPHYPAAPPRPAQQQQPVRRNHELPLFVSLHTAASEAGDSPAGGVGGGLLLRLRTESLPSPSTLAIVDSQSFPVNQHGSGSTGGSDGWLLGSNGNVGGLRNLRDSSMATIPSSYSMDWCTLSARSEALLTPKAAAAAATAASDGTAARAVAFGKTGGAAGGNTDSLANSSLFHRFCQEARSTLVGMAAEAKAAVTGLTRHS